MRQNQNQNRNQNQNQNQNRSRGRGRKPGNQSNRSFDSNGPDVKIRGSASHIYEKYQTLSRDANAAGDRVGAENYMQHAEHYFRLMAVAQAAQQSREQQNQSRQKQATPESNTSSNGSGTQSQASASPAKENAKPVEVAANAEPVSAGKGDEAPADIDTLPAAYRPDDVKKETPDEASGAKDRPARKRRPRQPKAAPNVEAKAEPKMESSVEAEAPADSPISDDAPA